LSSSPPSRSINSCHQHQSLITKQQTTEYQTQTHPITPLSSPLPIISTLQSTLTSKKPPTAHSAHLTDPQYQTPLQRDQVVPHMSSIENLKSFGEHPPIPLALICEVDLDFADAQQQTSSSASPFGRLLSYRSYTANILCSQTPSPKPTRIQETSSSLRTTFTSVFSVSLSSNPLGGASLLSPAPQTRDKLADSLDCRAQWS